MNIKHKIKWRTKGFLEFSKFQISYLKNKRCDNGSIIQDSTKLCFIGGCGRSGTTLTGNLLSFHPGVFYLNEPRPFWLAISNETDIWGYSNNSDKLNSLILKKMNAEDQKAFNMLFSYVSCQHYGQTLIEKSPENIFRLSWLASVHPEMKFINVIRNGYDVIRSVVVESSFNIPYGLQDMNNWYGRRFVKQKLLLSTALELGISQDIINSCQNQYELAALEWICSHIAMEQFLSADPSRRVHTLRYEEIVERPWVEIKNVFDFLAMDVDSALEKKIQSFVKGRKRTAIIEDLSLPIKQLFEHYQRKLGY